MNITSGPLGKYLLITDKLTICLSESLPFHQKKNWACLVSYIKSSVLRYVKKKHRSNYMNLTCILQNLCVKGL